MAKKYLGPDVLEFERNPSQWVTVVWIMIAFGFVVIFKFSATLSGILAIIWLCHRWYISCWKYEFRERTIGESKGVLSISKREIHYFRVKSIRVERPFLYRIVGLTTYDLVTSDPLIPIFRIYAIDDDGTFQTYLKEKVTYWRTAMDVKEKDFHNF